MTPRRIIRAFALAAVTAVATLSSIAASFAQPAPVPALPDAERRTAYSISASTCACSVNFALYGDSTDYANWIEVFVNGVQATYNDPVFGWTITSPTGPIATIPRPITDGVLTFKSVQTGTIQIVGARRPRRVSQFNENTGVPARNLNQVLTDIIAMLREDWDKINDVTGRVVRAPPGETMTTLPPAANRANMNVCFDSSGNLTPCVSIPTGSVTGGSNINLTGSNPTSINLTAGTANTVKASLTGSAETDLALPSCSLASQALQYISGTGFACAAASSIAYPSRAGAAALNLSALSAISTLGYSTAGDGGGATFKNVGSGAFKDTVITAGFINQAGSGCTNGTYSGVVMIGGTGNGALATIVVAGGIVTSVTITTPAGGYAVGDQLTQGTAFTCTGAPNWQVSTISSPLGSFTDSVGTHFQIVAGSPINIKQFGAKVDWTKAAGDAGATNDTSAIQAALNFAYIGQSPTIDAGGALGQKVIIPAGYSLACALVLPEGVDFRGPGPWSGGLKECDALAAASHFITVCDSASLSSCFGSFIGEMQLFPGSGSANSGTAMIFSNNIQQMNFISRVTIAGGLRSCIRYTNGYGGAAQIGMSDFECGIGGTTNPGIFLDGGGSQTLINMQRFNIEAGGGGLANNGLAIVGGIVTIETYHTEGLSEGIFLNIPANSGGLRIHNMTGGAHCTDAIVRQSGSSSGVNVAGQIWSNGCTNAINNAGALTTGNVVADATF